MTIVIGTGSSIAHVLAYNVTKWRPSCTLFRMPTEKRAFYPRNKNGDIVHCALGNGVDSYINEGRWLSECRVSLAERKKDDF